MDTDQFEKCDIHTTTVGKLADVAMHRLLCRTCNPDELPCEFYLPVEVDGRDMMLTLTAELRDMTKAH